MDKETDQSLKDLQQRLKVLIRSDFWVILVCLLALLGCAYTIYNIGSYKEQCNQYWNNYIKADCRCSQQIVNYTMNFTPLIPIYNEVKGETDEQKNNNINNKNIN